MTTAAPVLGDIRAPAGAAGCGRAQGHGHARLPCVCGARRGLTALARAGSAFTNTLRDPTPLLAIAPHRLAASPIAYLRSMAFINFLGFAGWSALLHNFTIEQAHFGWFENGLAQTVREIPGFLAFTAIFWL